jgi:hypothetical protein
MRERFPRRNDSDLRCPNDNCNDKSQRDYSGPPRERKPDDLVAAVDRPSRGRKTTTPEEFEKLLQKKCPWHPGANHAAIDCYHLWRTFSNPGGSKKNKPADKEPKEDDQEDKSHSAKYQDANFESSYHAILGRPALAKFMVVPHYVYFLLKMLGRSGVLTLRGDLKKSYDCN